jgi:hypothetical protein
MFLLFDRMRRKRNDAFYDVTIISDTEADESRLNFRTVFVDRSG